MRITDDYREQNAQLHREQPDYGTSSKRLVTRVASIIHRERMQSVLDYGAGKGELKRGLAKALPAVPVAEYDPAIPSMAAEPAPADLVVCTDVLEHVEPECLDAVLAHLNELVRRALFVAISCQPGSRKLPDGRLAHVSLHPAEWWAGKLLYWFGEYQYMPTERGDDEFVALLRRHD